MTAAAVRPGATGREAGRDGAASTDPAQDPVRARHLGLAFRRVMITLAVIACLAGGALAVRAASVWTASMVRFPETQPSIATLTQRLADEQARADALQAELDQLVGGSTELASALDAAGSRFGGDATAAESVRAGLAAARARLLVLQQALAAAGAPFPSRAPAPAPNLAAGAPVPGTTSGGAAGSTSGATATPTAPTAATTYPPGVPADWPASQPIPSMPAGCVQPQLELNGVWNCQH